MRRKRITAIPMLLPVVLSGLLPASPAVNASVVSGARLRDQVLTSSYDALSRGDSQWALDELAVWLHRSPADIEARRYAAHALLANNQPEEAARNFMYCASSSRPHPADWWHLGEALERTADYRGAIAHYSHALQCNPHCSQAYEGLARCYILLGAPQHVAAISKRAAQYGCKLDEAQLQRMTKPLPDQIKG